MPLERPEYLQKLIEFRDTDLIKVVTGIRRCGKSTLLKIYADYLRENGVAEHQIIFLNFEDFNNAPLTAPQKLHDYIKAFTDRAAAKTYVFLDEIQMVDDFEKVVNSLHLDRRLDIYLTGSNAYFLSGEMATLLAGRYIAIKMTPLSFKEYCLAVSAAEPNYAAVYADYLRYSSFPYAIELGKNVERINHYLAGIVNTIILKDVVQRKKITAVAALERLLRFIFANIGNITSTKKIADTMKTFGYHISVQTVETYLAALQDSFIIYKVSRLDVNGKEYLKANDKYYVADLGLRFYLLGDKRSDYGAILENIIYLELVRRGYEVFVGRVGDLEIDFIAIKSGVPTYYQVALTVNGEETWQCEIRPLAKIRDNYEKFIITMDAGNASNDCGIKTINALEFLLGAKGN